MKFAIGLIVLVATVLAVDASYLGYGGVVGDLTPRTGFAAPSTNFRSGNFGVVRPHRGVFYSKFRRAAEVPARSREARDGFLQNSISAEKFSDKNFHPQNLDKSPPRNKIYKLS
jgi:hypothetical protein